MKKYNHTIYAILGILTTPCKTGYAIKQMIDQSLNHFWKISYGQIYPALKQIVKEDLATVHMYPQEGKPDRKEYELTAKGKEVLKGWLENPIEQIPVERNELLLKLFFGRHQSNEKTWTHLTTYKQKLIERYKTYSGIEQMLFKNKADNADVTYWLLTLDYGKRITIAAIEWCDATVEDILKREE